MTQPYGGAAEENDLAGARVLVTGGSGFIGTRVVAALIAAGAEPLVADLNPHPDPDIPIVLGDLCDPAVRRRAVTPGLDGIIHLAALTSVLKSIETPGEVYRTNVDMTAGLLELAREHEVPRLLFASTNAVTGDVGATPIDESLPLRPLTPYGATKAASEMLISAYTACYGVAGCATRFANVYGPGMHAKDSMIPRLMRAARDGGGVQIYGDGTQVRDFVHVDDVVQALFVAWRTGQTGPLVVGSGVSNSVLELVEAVRVVTGAPLPVTHVPAKSGEMPAVVLNPERLRGLGHRLSYDLKAGLATVWPDFSNSGEAK